jgi:hypothetical protein
MKKHLYHVASKINYWNLCIGLVLGFAIGVWTMNLLIPHANDLIRLYANMNKESRMKSYEEWMK